MKKRILSLVVTLIVAVSVVLGVSIFASADNTDGLKQSAISLAENVTLKMEVAVAAPTEGAYAKITLPGGKGDATQLVATAPKNGDNYVFFAEVAVKDLAKDVTVEICDKDGATLVAPATTTALAYCDAYTEGEFLGLVGALKAYANAADYYFDGSKNATEAAATDFSAVADVKTSGATPAGLTHRSATLLLESETTIRHYFELAEGKKIENYTFFVDANANGACDAGEKVVPASKTTSDEKTVYYVDIAGITPNELDKVYTVGVIGVADGVTYTCDYGVLTYAKRIYANDAVDTKNLAAALLGYNTEAGKLTGTVKFVTDGSAVADQTYEYGVDFPVVATTSASSKAFLYWADENGKKVDTIPSSSTGDITLTAVWKSFTSYSWSTDCSNVRGIYNGYCPDHEDGNGDEICDNCGYCIAQCDAQTCSKCGKKTEGNTSYGMLNTRIWENQSYSIRKIKDGIVGDEIGFKQSLSNDTAYLGFGGTSYANANAKGANQIVYNFTLAKADEDSPVLRLYGRVRASADKSGSAMNIIEITDAGMFKIVGKDSNVYLTTDPHTYSLIVDISDSVSRDGKTYFTASLYVDGVLAYTGENNRNYTLDKYDSDNFLQFRVREGSGEGKIWFGDEISIKSVYTENVIRIAGEDKAIPYSYTPGTVTKLPTPTKAGFEFAGWYADAALTQPIDAIPANSYGEVKIYAKWNPVILDQSFDADYAGINKSTGASGKFEVANGALLWAPTKNDSGTQPSMTTTIQPIANYAVPDSIVTYSFEFAKAEGYSVLPINFRNIYNKEDGNGGPEFQFIRIQSDGRILTHNGKLVTTITEEFVSVDVVMNFADKTASYYVNGLYTLTVDASDKMGELSAYTNGGRCLNIYPMGTAAAGEAPTQALLFGKIAINGGVNVADVDIDVTTVCTKHVDADDNGFCDNCPEVAFRDGAEALKSETVDEYKVSVGETIIIPGTPTYSDAPHIFKNDEKYSVSIIDVQNTTFDMVYFTVEAMRANNSDAWIGFAFLTEMPEAGKDLPFADGYNTIKFASYDKAVEIPADAKYLLICDKEPSGNKEVYYYPAEVTFKKETGISENLRDNTLATYTITNEMIVPGYGVIRYYDPWKDHVFARDTRNSDSKKYAVAFLSIEGCVFEHIEFTAPISAAKEFGWTFLTKLPKAGEVVSYATGYNGFKWTTNYTTTTDIPTDAAYLVIYYQDSWDEKDHYHFDSITFINDGVCNHDALPTTVYATMFNGGVKAGHCDVCGKDVTVETPANEVTVYSRDKSWSGGDTSYYNTPYVYPLLEDGKHFYPTEEHEDGQSLFIEFSVLFNETHELATKNGKAWLVPGMLSDEDFDTFFKPFYIHIDPNDTKYCLFTGGVELNADFVERYDNDVTTYKTSGSVSNDVINNFFGWHRIGVKYWQHCYIKDGKPTYTMYSTLYIDGQPVVEQKKTSMSDHLLYEAKVVDGKLVYSDSSDHLTRVTTAFIQHFTPSGDGTMYTPVTDAYVSIGEDFILDVTPLTTPKADTYEVAPGVVLDAPWCFEYACTAHADADDNGKCDKCDAEYSDGCDVTPCVDKNDDLKCDNCDKDFDDGCDHVTVNYTETKVPTLFAEGEETGACAACGVVVGTKAIAKTEATVTKYNASGNSAVVKYSEKVNISSVLGDKDFYPTEADPDGNDLFIEFSFLWNETLANNTKGMIDFFRFEKSDGSDGNTAYFMQFKDHNTSSWYAPYAGSFETGDRIGDKGDEDEIIANMYDHSILVGPNMPDHYKVNSETRDDYVFIGDYGWHRLGLQIHQEHTIVDGAVNYTSIASLYIDGVLVSSYVYAPATGNLLYTVTNQDGEFKCENIAADRVVSYYKLRDARGSDHYVVTADEYVTVGDSFYLDVTPVKNPEAKTYNLTDSKTVSGNEYFSFVECAHNNGEFTVKLATAFAEGSKTGVCADCGQNVAITYAKTETRTLTFNDKSSGSYGEKYSLRQLTANNGPLYPTEDDANGKSLFMEFSFLWDEDLANMLTNDYIYMGMVANSAGGSRFTSFHLCCDEVDDFWCQHVGGFEPDSNSNITGGNNMSMEGGAAKDQFPNIGDYGWHRLGFKISQETKVENGTIKHHVDTSIYIDGEFIVSYKWIRKDTETTKILYAAKLVDGKLVYDDSVLDGRYAFPYFLLDSKAESGKQFTFATADTYVTIGDDFVIDVEAVKNPTDGVYFAVK